MSTNSSDAEQGRFEAVSAHYIAASKLERGLINYARDNESIQDYIFQNTERFARLGIGFNIGENESLAFLDDCFNTLDSSLRELREKVYFLLQEILENESLKDQNRGLIENMELNHKLLLKTEGMDEFLHSLALSSVEEFDAKFFDQVTSYFPHVIEANQHKVYHKGNSVSMLMQKMKNYGVDVNRGCPVLVSSMDNADYEKVFDALFSKNSQIMSASIIPYGEGEAIKGFIVMGSPDPRCYFHKGLELHKKIGKIYELVCHRKMMEEQLDKNEVLSYLTFPKGFDENYRLYMDKGSKSDEMINTLRNENKECEIIIAEEREDSSLIASELRNVPLRRLERRAYPKIFITPGNRKEKCLVVLKSWLWERDAQAEASSFGRVAKQYANALSVSPAGDAQGGEIFYVTLEYESRELQDVGASKKIIQIMPLK